MSKREYHVGTGVETTIEAETEEDAKDEFIGYLRANKDLIYVISKNKVFKLKL